LILSSIGSNTSSHDNSVKSFGNIKYAYWTQSLQRFEQTNSTFDHTMKECLETRRVGEKSTRDVKPNLHRSVCLARMRVEYLRELGNKNMQNNATGNNSRVEFPTTQSIETVTSLQDSKSCLATESCQDDVKFQQTKTKNPKLTQLNYKSINFIKVVIPY